MADVTDRDIDSEWHRRAVGGLWEEIGELQFRFLVQEGLRPQHYLLDIGCGSLRGGVHFIGYLEPGHHYGVDRSQELLNAGLTIELPRRGVTDREPGLFQMEDFDFRRLGRKFDYALAVSVFTHLSLNSIIRCLYRVEEALIPGGRFYATFFEAPTVRQLDPLPIPATDPDWAGKQTYLDADPYHYARETFQWLCAGTRLNVRYVGDWGHPRGQRMLVFRKRRWW